MPLFVLGVRHRRTICRISRNARSQDNRTAHRWATRPDTGAPRPRSRVPFLPSSAGIPFADSQSDCPPARRKLFCVRRWNRFLQHDKNLHRSIYCCSAHKNRSPALCRLCRKPAFNRRRCIADDLVVMRSCHYVPPSPPPASNPPLLESNRAPTGGLCDGRG